MQPSLDKEEVKNTHMIVIEYFCVLDFTIKT